MGLVQKRVLEGTRDDFVAHLAERMREEVEAAGDDAKGTAKEKHGHDCAAKAIEWVIGEMEAWVEPPAGGDAPFGDAGDAAADGDAGETDRRAAAADAI